jgi:hypothetical protein
MATPARTKAEVLDRLEAQGERLRALGVEHLALFGSFARDAAGPDSDVDLLIDFVRGRKGFQSFMAAAVALENLLGRPVELVTRESLSPYLGPRILEQAEDVHLGTRVPAAHP